MSAPNDLIEKYQPKIIGKTISETSSESATVETFDELN